MVIIYQMSKSDATTHEITSESPVGVNSDGEMGRRIVRFSTTILTPKHKMPLYWINQIEYLWIPEHDSRKVIHPYDA